MGHRNVLCTNQMLDPKSEQVLSYIHPNHLTHFGEVGDYPNHHMYPVQSTIGNATGLDPQFAGHHRGSVMYGNQQGISQYYHPLSNFSVGGAAQPNIYHPYMLAPSSSSSSVPLNNGSASILPSSINLRDTGVSDGNATSDSLGRFSRRKDVDVIPGSFYQVAGPPNICLPSTNLSISSEPLQWGHQYKYAMPVTQPENQGIVICPPTNGADRRVMNGPSSVSIPPEPAFPHHHTMLHRSYRGQPPQSSNSAWMEQFGNHFVDEGCSSSNYTDQMAYMHGTSVNTGAVMIPNLGMQKYQDMPCNRESGFVTHHPPLPNYYHQHLPPMQNMSINSYNHHSQIPLPSYTHPINNMHSNNVFPPRVDVASDTGYPGAFHSVSEQANAPLREAAPEIIHGSFRLLSEDAAAALQIRGFYGFDETSDQHRDMRLDIDDMSYEELLALEEHIGVVNTGLPEESILKNLKTSARTTCSELDNSSEPVSQNENCIVCQVEYEEKERIGTLECGHSFHADCIKQWLLVKNLCPICKKPALETDRRS